MMLEPSLNALAPLQAGLVEPLPIRVILLWVLAGVILSVVREPGSRFLIHLAPKSLPTVTAELLDRRISKGCVNNFAHVNLSRNLTGALKVGEDCGDAVGGYSAIRIQTWRANLIERG